MDEIGHTIWRRIRTDVRIRRPPTPDQEPMPAPHDPAAPHPRPQLQRAGWTTLNGPWDFALDPDARWRHPAEIAWDRTIRVPFAPETAAGGVGDTGFYRACWYRRRVHVPRLAPGERLRLHFGAVDYAAVVWAG